MADSNSPPLIVGAGPVGLAAALFLARHGVKARIVDQQAERSPNSKALAVNPRTMELLESTGVTEQILSLGSRIVGSRFYKGNGICAQIEFAHLKLRAKYPFMVALSQSTTERLLAEAAAELGVRVEREVQLVNCQTADGVHAELEHVNGAATKETVDCPWMLAADGAHSTVRHKFGLDFPGSSFERTWTLADVRLNTTLAADWVHIVFVEDGFLFLLRVVTGDAEEDRQPYVYRVLGNFPDPLTRLVNAEPADEPQWQSTFHIAHRLVERMQVGNIYLAGDAAHIHSPVGARGMNLGIEDAWVLAELAHQGRLAQFHAMRHPVDQGVVRRIEKVTRMARGESAAARFTRSFIMPTMIKVPPVRRRMLQTVTGLDHPIGLNHL